MKNIISKEYIINEDGKVYNKRLNKEIKFNAGKKGYMKANLHCPGLATRLDNRKGFSLHRLVAMFYLPNYSDTLQVNHKNGIKSDNHKDNLEMVTNAENAWHAWNVLDSTERRNKLIERNKLCK